MLAEEKGRESFQESILLDKWYLFKQSSASFSWLLHKYFMLWLFYKCISF